MSFELSVILTRKAKSVRSPERPYATALLSIVIFCRLVHPAPYQPVCAYAGAAVSARKHTTPNTDRRRPQRLRNNGCLIVPAATLPLYHSVTIVYGPNQRSISAKAHQQNISLIRSQNLFFSLGEPPNSVSRRRADARHLERPPWCTDQRCLLQDCKVLSIGWHSTSCRQAWNRCPYG